MKSRAVNDRAVSGRYRSAREWRENERKLFRTPRRVIIIGDAPGVGRAATDGRFETSTIESAGRIIFMSAEHTPPETNVSCTTAEIRTTIVRSYRVYGPWYDNDRGNSYRVIPLRSYTVADYAATTVRPVSSTRTTPFCRINKTRSINDVSIKSFHPSGALRSPYFRVHLLLNPYVTDRRRVRCSNRVSQKTTYCRRRWFRTFSLPSPSPTTHRHTRTRYDKYARTRNNRPVNAISYSRHTFSKHI